MTTNERRSTAIARGVASLLVLVLFLGGLPFLLAHEVGWPLPTTVPTLDQVSQAITTGAIEDDTIIKALAVLVWLAWLNFAIAVALEAIAMARGRQARRRPGGRAAQQFAAQLLTSVSLAVSLLGRPATAAAGPDPGQLRLVVATALADQPAPAPEHVRSPIGGPSLDPGIGEPVESGLDAAGSSYVVQRRDTLWDIAERFLGDGLRWREIRDANVGRPQPGGVSLRQDSEEIQPGWELTIPHRAGEDDASSTADSSAASVTVEPGDTLWDIADEQLGDPYRWPDVFEENEGRPQPDGRALTDPDLIEPGWVLDLPGDEASDAPAEALAERVEAVPEQGANTEPPLADDRPVEPLTVRTPEPKLSAPPVVADADQRSAGAVGSREGDGPSVREDAPLEDEQGAHLYATAAAGLAAGVVLTLDRIRRARRRRREPGMRIPLPEGEAASAEQRLRAVADEDTYRFVNLALRDLARSSAASRMPPVVLVSHGQDDVNVHLVGAHAAPEGWSESEDGNVWSRSRPADLGELESVSGTPSRLPGLVTLGMADGGDVVLLNLAQSGCLHLDGDADQAGEVLRAWAMELSTTSRADAMQVVAHGIDGLPTDLERLETVDDPEDLRRRLAEPSAADSTVPATVLLAAGIDGGLASWIRVASEQRSDLVAVVAVPPPRPGAWSVRLDGDLGQLDPLGVEFTPLSVDETGLAAAPALLDEAKHEDDRPVPIPPPPDEDLVVLDEAPEAPTPQPTVRILGKVDVTGVGSFSANKTMELVVYLAMNREGSNADTILEALWPGQPPKPASLYTEAWRARKVLGAAPDGTPYLPDAELGIYRLSEGVALDYEEFQSHVAKARQQPDDAATHLRAALDLVRGQPLTKTATEYAWAMHDSYRIAQEIADAAHELAQLLLEAGRYDDATKAAEDGLKAEPASELLIRDLMEIAAASGNGGRVHDLMTRLRREVAEDGDANDADDYLHPDTVGTYELLVGRGSLRH